MQKVRKNLGILVIVAAVVLLAVGLKYASDYCDTYDYGDIEELAIERAAEDGAEIVRMGPSFEMENHMAMAIEAVVKYDGETRVALYTFERDYTWKKRYQENYSVYEGVPGKINAFTGSSYWRPVYYIYGMDIAEDEREKDIPEFEMKVKSDEKDYIMLCEPPEGEYDVIYGGEP